MESLSFDTLTFDCYGTLIGWESGVEVDIDNTKDRPFQIFGVRFLKGFVLLLTLQCESVTVGTS